MEILSHAIAKKATIMLEEEHLSSLPFIEADEGLYDHPAEKLQKLYAEHHLIDWDKVAEKVAESDAALINHVADELSTMMTRITTDLWKKTKQKKVKAAESAKQAEWLGRNAIKKANSKLSRAMESGVDPIQQVVDESVDARFKKERAAAKRQQRKKSSGGPKSQGSTPGGGGRSGGRGKGDGRGGRRGRPRKRSPTPSDDDESYESAERRRGRSRPRGGRDAPPRRPPKSALNKSVRWHPSVSPERENKSDRARTTRTGKGRGGRGRGRGRDGSGRGGRGRGGGRSRAG